MGLSISEKVVVDLQLAVVFLWVLWLPPPPKIDIPEPPLLQLHSSLSIQILSMHVKPNKIGVTVTAITVPCGNFEINRKMGIHVT